MLEPLIALRAVEKSFSPGVSQMWVLRRITLDIAEGEFVSVMGPSGAGKSTLLHILGMHDADWDGDYDFLGLPVHGLKARQRQALGLARDNIGFVFQSYQLLDDLTVAENLDVPLSYRNVPRAERQTLVADTLDRFQIVAKKDLYPSQLSGGQQQLVGVARAAERGRNHHRPGDPLRDERRLRPAHHPVARRLDCRRLNAAGLARHPVAGVRPVSQGWRHRITS